MTTNRYTLGLMLLSVIVLASGISSLTFAETYSYSVTDLGTLGGLFSDARGISNNGQVVGEAFTADGFRHAFLYSNGVMTDLGTLGGNTSVAYAINSSCQVTGVSEKPSREPHQFQPSFQAHGFLYSNGIMTSSSGLERRCFSPEAFVCLR